MPQYQHNGVSIFSRINEQGDETFYVDGLSWFETYQDAVEAIDSADEQYDLDYAEWRQSEGLDTEYFSD